MLANELNFAAGEGQGSEPVTFKPLGIDTWQEHVIDLHPDCLCAARARVQVRIGDASIIATLNLVGAPSLPLRECSGSRHPCQAMQ